MNMYFRHPELLWLLLLVPGWLIWYVLWYHERRKVVPLSYNPAALEQKKMGMSWLRYLPVALQLFGLACLILALARPQNALETKVEYAEGIDIMFMLDVSGSMEAQDFQPNRLEVMKSTALKFISGRVDDRIGIVLFAEDALTYCPLTLDYDYLKQQVVEISTRLMPKEGTAMGTAIMVGVNRLRDSESKSKIGVLISDGASNRGKVDPLMAANVARDYGIKLYTIAVGSNSSSQVNTAEFDEEALKKIAETTSGKYFRCTNELAFEETMNAISNMEKTEIKEDVLREVTDLYPRLLLAGFAAFVLAWLLMLLNLFNPLEE